MNELLIKELAKFLRKAGEHNPSVVVAPRAIIWPDGERLWQGVTPLLAAEMPELQIAVKDLEELPKGVPGGLACEIRYMLDRSENKERLPIIYLPGVSRADFRSAENFPIEFKHLFALQYLGVVFAQSNGKDWTPNAFLVSKDGPCKLSITTDKKTQEALLNHLTHILQKPLIHFQDKVNQADDFIELAVSDPIHNLLCWMGAPQGMKSSWDKSLWIGFIAICKQDYGFDPDKDGALVAAEKLAGGEGEWEKVWARFCKAPQSYIQLKDILEKVTPKGLFDNANPKLPAFNLQQEKKLANDLQELKKLGYTSARDALKTLVNEHSERANGPWATLGFAPLAKAMVYFGQMLEAMNVGFSKNNFDQLAEGYLQSGWKVDRAALNAAEITKSVQHLESITFALQAVYKPWLEELAETTQKLAINYPVKSINDAPTYECTPGTVYLFVDGLRSDIAQDISLRLTANGCIVEKTTQWAALPSVTATAKPAWKPMGNHLEGRTASELFEPEVIDKQKPCKTAEFRKLLEKLGFSFLTGSDYGNPETCAWAETGSFDSYGHNEGGKLAWRVEEEIKALIRKVEGFLQWGWKSVELVTDHGWLWLPGKLPKLDLPGNLTLSKWSRCAVAKPGSKTGFDEVSWFWGNQHGMVLAPGIGVFQNGMEYSHGGLTIQEALKLRIKVSSNANVKNQVIIKDTVWRGLRLHVTIEGNTTQLTVDVRTKPADENSSVLLDEHKNKSFDINGKATTLANESYLQSAAVIVVCENGQVLAKKNTTIGENE